MLVSFCAFCPFATAIPFKAIKCRMITDSVSGKIISYILRFVKMRLRGLGKTHLRKKPDLCLARESGKVMENCKTNSGPSARHQMEAIA
jgi:hypothetical protein